MNPMQADIRDRAQARRVFQRTLRLPVPLLDPKVFLKLLQLDLNAHPPGAPIVKVHLAAEPVRPRSVQCGLFLPPSPEPEKLELTLAKIAGIVGQDKVGSLQLLDTHRPEGFLMRHFASNRSTEKNNTGAGIISVPKKIGAARSRLPARKRLFELKMKVNARPACHPPIPILSLKSSLKTLLPLCEFFVRLCRPR